MRNAHGLTEWWIAEIRAGRVSLTHDVYWLLRDLARQEGYSRDQWEAFKVPEPERASGGQG